MFLDSATFAGTEDNPISGQLTGSDSDIPQSLTFNLDSQPPVGEGSVIVQTNGQFTWTHTPNFNGQTFTFTTFDGIDTSATAPQLHLSLLQ